jgi:AraC-like DNA-binding protein
VFLVDSTDSGARARAKLLDLAARASAIARRFELKLHSGIAPASGTESVVTRYREALGAAEKALSQGLSFAMGEARPERAARHLRMLRIELGQSAVEHPSLLYARFDRYVEAVLLRSGYHFETVAAQLEAGVERLMDPLLKTGALDDKSLEELSDSLETAAADAVTVASLVERYRQLVAEIERSALNPTPARHARSATRALNYIRDHVGDRLRLADVARVAGFAPQYFSKLMKREHGATFERYVRQLRLARAQQLLLSESTLDAERVAHLAGMGRMSAS